MKISVEERQTMFGGKRTEIEADCKPREQFALLLIALKQSIKKMVETENIDYGTEIEIRTVVTKNILEDMYNEKPKEDEDDEDLIDKYSNIDKKEDDEDDDSKDKSKNSMWENFKSSLN